MRLPSETVEELIEPAKIWQLLEPFGVRADNAALERGAVYTFNSGWATQWRKGRVFLLGDAAHQMPPFAGQGLAAGFRDCLNLSWKLNLVLKAQGHPSLLDTYTTERTMHVSDFIDFSMSLGRIICILDSAEAHVRDEAMLAERASGRTPAPPPAPRLGPGLHNGDAGGYLSWQGRVSTSEGAPESRYDDVFGPGGLILDTTALASSLAPAHLEELRGMGLAITAFGGAPREGVAACHDANGTYRAWSDRFDTHVVLVRPDFTAFGTASNANGVTTLARRFLEEVHGTYDNEDAALNASEPAH